MKTLNNRIIYELIPLEKIGTIHVPVSLQKSAAQMGKVRYLPENERWLRANDYILFHRFCGKEIEIEDEKLYYVDREYVLAVLRK